jgi:hypothetical protein
MYFALIATTVIVYCPILFNDFLFLWDDQWVVINRYTEGGLNLWNLWYIFSEYYHGQYAPFNELLYLLLYSAFGYTPFWFHLAGMLLHIACACLVFHIVRRLLFLGVYAHARTYVWHDTDSLKKELREKIKQRNGIEALKNEKDD